MTEKMGAVEMRGRRPRETAHPPSGCFWHLPLLWHRQSWRSTCRLLNNVYDVQAHPRLVCISSLSTYYVVPRPVNFVKLVSTNIA